MTLEYPGYGKSEGKSTKTSFEKAANALLVEAHKSGYEDKNIIIVGESLGSAPATYLAAKNNDIHSLVLISPFSKFKYVYGEWKVIKYILKYTKKDIQFDNLSKMNKISCPLHIFHSIEDPIFPLELHSQKLCDEYNKANNKNIKIEKMSSGHNRSEGNAMKLRIFCIIKI